MKLRARIKDLKNNSYEYVTLCQFKDMFGDKVFMKEELRFGVDVLHVEIDEGGMITEYYYPLNRYAIVNLARYVEE